MEYVPGGDCAALLSALAGYLPLDLTTYAFNLITVIGSELFLMKSEYLLINFGYIEDYK